MAAGVNWFSSFTYTAQFNFNKHSTMNNRTIDYDCKLLVFYSISISLDSHKKMA